MFRSKFNKIFQQILFQSLDQTVYWKRFKFRFAWNLRQINNPQLAQQILNDGGKMNLQELQNSLNSQEPISITFFSKEVFPYVIITKLQGQTISWKFDPAHIVQNKKGMYPQDDYYKDYFKSYSDFRKVNYDVQSGQEYSNKVFNLMSTKAYQYIMNEINAAKKNNYIRKQEAARKQEDLKRQQRIADINAVKQHKAEIQNVESDLMKKFNYKAYNAIIDAYHFPVIVPKQVKQYILSLPTDIRTLYIKSVDIEVSKQLASMSDYAQYADSPQWGIQQGRINKISERLTAFKNILF